LLTLIVSHVAPLLGKMTAFYKRSIYNVSLSSIYVLLIFFICVSVVQVNVSIGGTAGDICKYFATVISVITYALVQIYLFNTIRVTYLTSLEDTFDSTEVPRIELKKLILNIINAELTNIFSNAMLLYTIFSHRNDFFGRINNIATDNQFRFMTPFILATATLQGGYGINHIEIVPMNDTWFVELIFTYFVIMAIFLNIMVFVKTLATIQTSVLEVKHGGVVNKIKNTHTL
jgi:hypothetical protein